MEDLTKVPVELFYVMIATMGGMARYMQKYLKDKKFNIADLLANLIISAFSGYMFYLFSFNILGMAADTAALFVGIGGWMGAESIKFIETALKNINNKDN